MARITEKKRILVNHCGDDIKNPFYVMWYNTLGGIDYFLFGIRQKERLTISDLKTYTPSFSDVENGEFIKTQLRKRAAEFVVCSASNISENAWKGILSLASSLKVYYATNKDEIKWKEAIPVPGTLERDNYSEGHNVEIVFMLPDKFLPSG